MKFEDITFDTKLKEAISKLKYKNATEVQEKTIPAIMKGENVLCKSYTGSGKTLAFGIPLSDRLIKDSSKRVLILEPTRELAIQVKTEINKLNRFSKLSSATIYGGHGIQEEIKKLSRDPHFVIATPGRLIDHTKRKTINMDFDTVVLDEADRMLDMGFIEDMKLILKKVKPDFVHLFSATLEGKISSLISRYIPKHFEIDIADELIGKNIIEKNLNVSSNRDKMSELEKIIKKSEGGRVLIFVSTKKMVDILTAKINNFITDAVGIHGDKSQRFREFALQDFKKGRTQVLVATDVAARGLQINNVEYVVNYDPAGDSDTHKHRIGRTGRMGETGNAITLVSPEDKKAKTQNKGRGRRNPQKHSFKPKHKGRRNFRNKSHSSKHRYSRK